MRNRKDAERSPTDLWRELDMKYRIDAAMIGTTERRRLGDVNE